MLSLLWQTVFFHSNHWFNPAQLTSHFSNFIIKWFKFMSFKEIIKLRKNVKYILIKRIKTKIAMLLRFVCFKLYKLDRHRQLGRVWFWTVQPTNKMCSPKYIWLFWSSMQNNRFFATNYDYLISICFHPNACRCPQIYKPGIMLD